MSDAIGDVYEAAAPLEDRLLSTEHRDHLTRSAISDEVIQARGYYSLTREHVGNLVQLELIDPRLLKASSWLGIPIYRPDGKKHCEVIRVFGVDWRMKYMWPKGITNTIDLNPLAFEHLFNRDVPILFTEGSKKADAILASARIEGIAMVPCSINGCWGWRSSVAGGKIALQDFHDIPLNDRKTLVVSDSDFRTNDSVAQGWNAAAAYLESKTGPHRTFMVVVPASGLEKRGADDYLQEGGSLGDLLGLAQSPKHALLESNVEQDLPLIVKTGMDLLEEARENIPHLITPIIPERSIVLLAGHSGTYKTWHGLSLSLDLAFGTPWLGHPSLVPNAEPITSIYVNKEMSGVILGQRLKTLIRNEKYLSTPNWEDLVRQHIRVIDEAALDLREPRQRDRLEEAIVTTKARIVFLDSLSMSWTGDENSAWEVGQFFMQLRTITERTGCSWGLILHLIKPQAGARKIPIQFAVRGSGQLYQQADAALIFEQYDVPAEATDQRVIAITHAKARTSLELPAWMSSFSMNDGFFTSLNYAGNLSEAQATVYTESKDGVDQLVEWLSTVMQTFPALLPEGDGMRTGQLITGLQMHWPLENKLPPSESTFRRALTHMKDTGMLDLLEENKRQGNLYRFPKVEEAVLS